MPRNMLPNRYSTDAIKKLIQDRGLLPGDLMPTEAELVEELGVSRSSVREAVRTLVALDILEVRHGSGTFVGQLSLRPLVEGMVFRGVLMPGDGFETLREIIEVRAALDQALAPRIVERLAGSPAPELRADVNAMLKAAARNRGFADQDRMFHLRLAEQSGNQLYGQLVAAFWDIHTTLSPRLGLPSAWTLKESAQAHAAMLDAALAGDLAGYRATLGVHYNPVLQLIDGRSGVTGSAAAADAVAG